MSGKKSILPSSISSKYGALLLFFFLLNPVAYPFATPLRGTPLGDAYFAMYNLDFTTAHQLIQQWMAANPEDPLGPASDAAAYIFSEFDQLGVLDIDLFADDTRFTSPQASRDRSQPQKGFLRPSRPGRASCRCRS